MINFFKGPSNLVTFRVFQEFLHDVRQFDPRFLISADAKVIKFGDLILDDITVFDETGNSCFRYTVSFPSSPIAFARWDSDSKTGDQIRELLLNCLRRYSHEEN